jgi:hypothetical protein
MEAAVPGLKAKVKEQEEIQKKGVDRLRELYKEANSLKANRQIQACEITPPDSKRRKSAPGAGGIFQELNVGCKLLI